MNFLEKDMYIKNIPKILNCMKLNLSRQLRREATNTIFAKLKLK